MALAAGTSAAAPPPSFTHGPARLGSIAVVDNERRMDANRINMFVTNVGSFAWDLRTGNPGLIYPKSTGNTLIFAGGLWVGGYVGGQLRVTVAEYSQEFGPGPMVGGTFDDPTRPEHVVYKVRSWTGDPADTAHVMRGAAELAADPNLDPLLHHSWSEYIRGAAPYGAPTRIHRLPDPSTSDPSDSVDVPGPDFVGDQMLWTVFNDANAALHTNDAGDTPPLGLEVRLAASVLDRVDGFGDVAFLRYRLVHEGTQPIDSAYVSLWADADVGGGADDLVGSDTTSNLGYAYNVSGMDMMYGVEVPAVGIQLLRGPTGPSGMLPMTAFSRYIGGVDPTSATQTYNLMSGLAPDGTPRIDPTTGLATRYMHPGDPVSGTGWLDANPADRRFMVSSGPFYMMPGDSQDIVVAIIVGAGTDPISSVNRLRCMAQQLQSTFPGSSASIDCPATAPLVRNCPRPDSFWRAACGGSHLGTIELEAIAACIDQRSMVFDWGASPRDSLCALMTSAGIDPASLARRAFAALLASRCAGDLGIVPQDGQAVFLDSTSSVHCQQVSAVTVGEVTARAEPERGLRDALYLDLNELHPRALDGVDQGLASFRGGADEASDVLGSALQPATTPDSFSTVELRFLATPSAKAYRFLRLEVNDGSGDGPAPPQGRVYLYAGYRPVKVEAWDLDSGRQLELAFIERTLTDAAGTILPRASQPATFDSTWSPNVSSLGGRELLMVVRREYSTAGRVPEIGHDGAPADGATPFLYTLWARLRHSSSILDPGDAFQFRAGYLGHSADAALLTLATSTPDSLATVEYARLAECLGSISDGFGIPLVCAPSVLPSALAIGSEVEPNRVRVTWTTTGTFSGNRVQRCSDSGCVVVGIATADATGRLTFEDLYVQPGELYTYRLGLMTQGRLHLSGAVDIEVPLTVALRVMGVAPNPAPARLRITFLLSSNAPARLTLHDIAGRQVSSQNISFPVPGRQTLELDPPSSLSAGIYFVRIEQRGQIAARKVVILR
jgi:hypothetical protein